jgi:uncharacterized protein YegJ (DUF2314 family)
MIRLIALSLAASLAAVQPLQAQDPVIQFSATDALMDKAVFDARQTLPLFLTHVLDADGQPLRPDILVKVGMPTAPGTEVDGEDVWLSTPQRLPDGSFSATLVNDPSYLGDLAKGDTVSFGQDMISDWFMMAPSGLYYGSYTLRVLHGQGAFGQTPFDQVFEADPVPPDWR